MTGQGVAIDGDTLQLQRIPMRIQGIDAPEWHEPGGREAQRQLDRLLSGHTVACTDTGQRSHGRWVVTCTIAGRDLGEALVSAGVALDCARYSGGRYRAYEPAGARLRLKPKPYC